MTVHQTPALTRAQLDRLGRSFTGEVVTPDASGYDDARRVWNAVFDRRPALVVRPTGVDDVVAAIRFGRELDLFWGLRGAGANFGVATALEFELQPFAGTLYRSARIHPASEIRELWP